ncbi:hypothetical protein chiPu_0007716 [Chiloscyllium punctatum]|uniref:Uncharacterized protein n=1 Tax=Chiloscyllium punctatum TaxID=137246 RepID=A0A401SFV5_CHIPU|nr:hypothetical protein [Chiloscyllium punctatum]
MADGVANLSGMPVIEVTWQTERLENGLQGIHSIRGVMEKNRTEHNFLHLASEDKSGKGPHRQAKEVNYLFGKSEGK